MYQQLRRTSGCASSSMRHSLQRKHPIVLSFSKYSINTDLLLQLILLVMISSLIITIQFLLRDFDDNRLISWQWVMRQDTLFAVLSLILVGQLAAYSLYCFNIIRRLSMTGITVCAILVALTTWSLPEFMLDSSRYFGHAKTISVSGVGYFLTHWGSDIDAWTDLPLLSILYGFAFSLFGEHRIVVQIINTTFYIGAIYLTYLIGKLWWNSDAGICAALLLMSFPYLTVQVSQLLLDVPLMFFTLLAIYCSARAIQSGPGLWFFTACISIAATILSKYTGWVLLGWIILLPLALKHIAPSRTKLLISYNRVLLLAIGTAMILFAALYSHFAIVFDQIDLLREFQLPAFVRWQESLVSTFLFQIHPVVTVTALMAIFIAVRHRDASIVLFVAAIVSLLLIGANRARYLMIVFPMLALLSAYSLQSFGNKMLPVAIGVSVAITGTVLSLFANSLFLNTISATNIQLAGKYLDKLHEPYALVVNSRFNSAKVNPEVIPPILDYYTKKTILVTKRDSGAKRTQHSKNNPLRFTWSVNFYPYQKFSEMALNPADFVIVHIANSAEDDLPTLPNIAIGNFTIERQFLNQDQVFKLQTVITIYRHNPTIERIKDS